MLLWPFLTAVGFEEVFAGVAGGPARRFDDLCVLGAGVFGFALGASSLEGIKHLGRGNTRGDAIVYLPKEKVLVAGDLLDYPVPSLGSGYPEELITTLQKMAQLEAQTIVPGHGEVLRDHAHLNLVVKLLQTVVTQVDQDIFRLGNGPRHLDEVTQSVQKNPEIAVLRRTFTGDDKDNQEFFDNFSLPGLIQAAYAEAWGR